MLFNDILSRFQKVKKIGANQYAALCPAHNDTKPSLHISDGGDKILLNCKCNCSYQEIMEAIGLTRDDGFYDQVDIPKKEYILYDYKTYYKARFPGKRIRYGQLDANGDFYECKLTVPHRIYKEDNLQKARYGAVQRKIYYVEGEKDVDTLTRKGFLAVTAGGASDWRREFAPLFKGQDVIIIPDNDDPGKKLAERVEADIKAYAFKVSIARIPSEYGKDTTDYVEAGQDIKALNEEDKGSYFTDKGKVVPDALAHLICRHYHFIRLKEDTLYIYDNGIYKELPLMDLKHLIKDYIKTGYASNSALNNIAQLVIAETPVFTGEEDRDRIALQNGLYNIHTGELEEYAPEKIFFRKLNAEYKPEAQCPKWQDFLEYAQNGDISFTQELQELIGLALSNLSARNIKKAFVFFSEQGDTGKSIIFKTLTYIIGSENISNIPIQQMADRFMLSAIYNKRLNIVGDQYSGEVRDISVFKQLTGGDLLNIEYKGKQPIQAYYHGLLIMGCNKLPKLSEDKGDHIFKRFEIIPMRRVVTTPNLNLDKELEAEADGIFLWAMQGLERLMKNNFIFTTTREGADIKEAYRQKSDTLYEFLCTEPFNTDKVKKTDFEDKYYRYCTEEGIENKINKRNIKDRARELGIEIVIKDGIRFYKNLSKYWDNPYKSAL